MFDAYEKGTSIKKIKDYLDHQGVPAPRTKSGLWNTATLRLMLSNKSYTGLHTVKETKKIGLDAQGKPIREVVGEYTYKVPKIISTGQFNRVQKDIEQSAESLKQQKTLFIIGRHLGLRVRFSHWVACKENYVLSRVSCEHSEILLRQ